MLAVSQQQHVLSRSSSPEADGSCFKPVLELTRAAQIKFIDILLLSTKRRMKTASFAHVPAGPFPIIPASQHLITCSRGHVVI